jgi:hypothetical protein
VVQNSNGIRKGNLTESDVWWGMSAIKRP